MSTVFIQLLNMSITASWLVLAVILLRLLLKKAPKWIMGILWGLVAVRLICPFSPESMLSLIPSAEPIPQDIVTTPVPVIDSGIPPVNDAVDSLLSQLPVSESGSGGSLLQGLAFAGGVIWLVGLAAMLSYLLMSYLKIRRRVREAILLKDNIWACDQIPAPFILGIVRPRIYLPYAMGEADRELVLAHEKAHLARRDHIWKPLGFLLLSVYWFNPILWAAYLLMCRDIELACDERVIRRLGAQAKKSYADALINCSAPRRAVTACPLAFGETGVRERVKGVLHYKKPALWLILAGAAACAVTAVCLLTDPVGTTVQDVFSEKRYTIISQVRRDITLSVPKSVVPDQAYSDKGHTFGKGQVVAYQTDTTTIYLERIQPANEGKEKLYLIFNASYELPASGSFLATYYKTEAGYTGGVGLRTGNLRDDAGTYEDALSTRSQGPDAQFAFYVSTDVFRNAAGTVRIDAFCHQIVYREKNGNAARIGSVEALTLDEYAGTRDVMLFDGETFTPVPDLTRDSLWALLDLRISKEPASSRRDDGRDMTHTVVLREDAQASFANSNLPGIYLCFSRDFGEVWAGGSGLAKPTLSYRVSDPAKAQRLYRSLAGGGSSQGGTEPPGDLEAAVAYANYTDDPRLFAQALNAGALSEGSRERHLPIFRFGRREELDGFRKDFQDILTMDQGYDEVPSFDAVTQRYDASFFEDHVLLLVYVSAGSGSRRFGVSGTQLDGGELCVFVTQTNDPETETQDMCGWFITIAVGRETAAGCDGYDAVLDSAGN